MNKTQVFNILMAAGFIIVLITFLNAYNSPSKTTTISVDSFGEANIEFALLLFGVILIYWRFFKGK